MLETGHLYAITIEVFDRSSNKVYPSDVSALWDSDGEAMGFPHRQTKASCDIPRAVEKCHRVPGALQDVDRL